MSAEKPGSGVCELCWGMAFERMHLFGGSQYEHYMKLLKETEGMLGHGTTPAASAADTKAKADG